MKSCMRKIQSLFKENWNKIKKGEIISQPQMGGGAFTLEKNLLCSSHLSEKKDGTHRSENLRNNITNVDIKLRGLKNDDIHDLFNWRNHPDVRKNFLIQNLYHGMSMRGGLRQRLMMTPTPQFIWHAIRSKG